MKKRTKEARTRLKLIREARELAKLGLDKPASWIPKTWTFESAAVAVRFDEHVREQLPWYDHLLNCLEHFAAHYIPRGGVVYDFGSSTGNFGRRIDPYLMDREANLYCVEASRTMAGIAHCGPRTEIEIGNALATTVDPFDFAVCNLTLMFLPVAERGAFVRKLCGACREGGAVVVVDKVISPAGYLGTVFRRMAMKWKTEAGASPDAILAKELSLGGIQRPINPHIIPVDAQRFFQFGEFTGWIWEKSETGRDA